MISYRELFTRGKKRMLVDPRIHQDLPGSIRIHQDPRIQDPIFPLVLNIIIIPIGEYQRLGMHRVRASQVRSFPVKRMITITLCLYLVTCVLRFVNSLLDVTLILINGKPKFIETIELKIIFRHHFLFQFKSTY